MASTADPSGRCQADLTGGVPSDVRVQKLQQLRTRCPYSSVGTDQFHRQVKAHPVPAPLQSEV